MLALYVPSSITKHILVACVFKMAVRLSMQASSKVMREMSLLTEDDSLTSIHQQMIVHPNPSHGKVLLIALM